MEILFEFIFELIFEGSIEVSKSKKVSKYIRYPLIVIISLFFIAIIGLVFYAGILSLKKNIIIGIFFILIGIFMLISSILEFRKVYLTNKFKRKGNK